MTDFRATRSDCPVCGALDTEGEPHRESCVWRDSPIQRVYRGVGVYAEIQRDHTGRALGWYAWTDALPEQLRAADDRAPYILRAFTTQSSAVTAVCRVLDERLNVIA